jgi:prevent-host-death family protein
VNHHPPNNTVSIKEAKNRLSELVRRVEAGESITLTRNGKPVAEVVQPRKPGGIDVKAGRAYLRSIGVEDPFPYVAEDFNDPLPGIS